MQLIARGIAAVAVCAAVPLVLAPVASADPNSPPSPPMPCGVPGKQPCPGFPGGGPLPTITNDGCHMDPYGAWLICPGPRTCGPFGCSDGSPSPG